jgi:hypothetical protein
MKRTVLLLLIVLVSSLPLQAAGLRFKPGLWEITASTAGPHPHAQTTRRCYTPEEVKVANGSAAEVAAATRANAATRKLESTGCKLQEIRLVGAQITEVIVCPTYSLEDVTTYRQGDTFESDTTMTPKQGPERKVHRVARRVGDCPK